MENDPDLEGRTFLITGGSRGIGKAIGLAAARRGANVVVAAKTDEPHPRLPGTIHTAVREIESAGGRGLALVMDVRFEDQVDSVVERTVEEFGGIDVLVNNAGAISLTPTLETTPKRFDLMHSVNVRGTWICSRACIPHLARSRHAHILCLCPPPSLEARWLAPHLAYSLSKFGMSLCVIGLAREFEKERIAVNGLWPRTTIATSAMRMLGGDAAMSGCRTVDIVADAALAIVRRDPAGHTGEFHIDEDVLEEEGIVDLDRYAVDPEADLMTDLFLD